ncbi:hypothetical protein [Beijerinckia indica]|uniref:Uncharacterized protein n=1 Tax=Beijerinckia indica subsp. indica (strain ATCC 9039 / DSM 1715 / NCIMB 8712) TaxID=395963 RepID=B2IJC2_BEII9|nr:hypothetical protein [Beijerinckia indica]ACB96240.1 hypothetical protein Bind_2668 [Beijerinckia indica subsp. indica ATCC 9039]
MEYGTFEAILSRLHKIKSEEEKAFRSRLRILRDINVPNVRRPGKGARVDYRFSDLFITHLGLIYDKAGFPPSIIKEIVEEIEKPDKSGNLLDTIRESSLDLWYRLTTSKPNAEGKSDGITLELRTLSDHFNYLKTQEIDPQNHDAPVSWSMVVSYSLVNVTAAYRDCRKAAPKYEV